MGDGFVAGECQGTGDGARGDEGQGRHGGMIAGDQTSLLVIRNPQSGRTVRKSDRATRATRDAAKLIPAGGAGIMRAS